MESIRVAPARRDGGAVLLRSRAESNTSSSNESNTRSKCRGACELIEVEPWEMDRWCRNHLGSGIDEELFLYGHLSAVIGIRLISGPQVVVKIRRASDRLVACADAHRVLFERGFPCPELLAT